MDILVADDEDDIRNQVCAILEDEGYSVRSASTIAAARAEIVCRLPSLAIIDVWFSHCEVDGLSLLNELLNRRRDLPVIMMSGHSNIDMAVRAIKLGAHDFLTKPFALENMLLTVERAFQAVQLSREHKEMSQQLGLDRLFIETWRSSAMQSVMKLVEQWAHTERRLLICGEFGTGKSNLTLHIHRISKRNQNVYIRHNCLDYDDSSSQIEALFGIEGGKIGKLELTHNGTLVLEHIEYLPSKVQQKLSSFMQSHRFYRQGGNQRVQVNVRILSLTALSNKELNYHPTISQAFIDLISLGVISLPSLRQRHEDFPQLVSLIREKLNYIQGNIHSAGTHLKLNNDAFKAISAYSWPRNIRELENVLSRLYWTRSVIGRIEIERAIGEEIIHQKTNHTQQYWQRIISKLDLPLREAREIFEYQYLHYHLERFQGNVSQTAQYVGMDRASLHRKIRNLSLGSLKSFNHEGSK